MQGGGVGQHQTNKRQVVSLCLSVKQECCMRKGQLVKYSKPVSVEEQDMRFVLLEDNGDRVLIQPGL